ncbi:chaperonin 10-like protein [Aspergillus unguis]
MRAYKLVNWAQAGQYVDVPKPTPGPLDVLVRVKAVGLCHSDLDMMESLPGSDPYASVLEANYILGHETAGVVEERGSAVTDLEIGEGVVVHHMRHCGFCEFCEAGIEQHCEYYKRGDIGMTRGCGFDGGLAEFLVVPRTELISIGKGDPVLYAPLTDAGVTAYAGLKGFLSQLRPGNSAAVIGIGGLGAYAVQFLKILTAAKVIAVDNVEARLKMASDLGADAGVLSDANAETSIRAVTGGKGVDAIIDLVGSDQTLQLAARVIRPQGFISVVGMQGGSVRLGWNRMATSSKFALSLGSTRNDLREVCQLATDGKLQIDIERFGFDEIPLAYEKLKKGQLKGRASTIFAII